MNSELLCNINQCKDEIISEGVSALLHTKYFEILNDVLAEFDSSLMLKSDIHGMKHVERTCLFGTLLSYELSLNKKDATLVITACAYHDIGRKSDGIDSEHGERSSKRVGKYVKYRGEDLEILRAMIEAHCRSHQMLEIVLAQYQIKDLERASILAKVLKDSDCLDRVRISDLDPSFLLFKESYKYIDFAEHLFLLYH